MNKRNHFNLFKHYKYITYIITFIFLIISIIFSSPKVQGIFIFLHFPFWWWLDFNIPNISQYYIFPGILRTNHHIIHYKDKNTNNSIQLGVWHTYPIKQKKNNFYIIYFHGNGETRANGYNLKKYNYLSSKILNNHVISFDYRGFADSTGYPSENGLYQDAEVILNWIYKLDKNVDNKNIILYGHSLGSAVATNLAKKMCTDKIVKLKKNEIKDNCPAGIILEAPFTTILDVMNQFLPIFITKLISSKLHYKFESIKNILSISCPFGIIHGEKDIIIPPKLGYEMFLKHKEACFQKKIYNHSFYSFIQNGSHSNLIESDKTKKFLLQFLNIVNKNL